MNFSYEEAQERFFHLKDRIDARGRLKNLVTVSRNQFTLLWELDDLTEYCRSDDAPKRDREKFGELFRALDQLFTLRFPILTVIEMVRFHNCASRLLKQEIKLTKGFRAKLEVWSEFHMMLRHFLDRRVGFVELSQFSTNIPREKSKTGS